MPFDAVHIQMGYNSLVGKAVEVETVDILCRLGCYIVYLL